MVDIDNTGNALLRATVAALATVLPTMSADEHTKRAAWMIEKKALVLDADGQIAIALGGLEVARLGGLLGLPPADDRSRREERTARLKAAEKRLAAKQAASRIPRPNPAIAVRAALEQQMQEDPTLRTDKDARSKASEALWETALRAGGVKP